MKAGLVPKPVILELTNSQFYILVFRFQKWLGLKELNHILLSARQIQLDHRMEKGGRLSE
jgi:hypothetical protein